MRSGSHGGVTWALLKHYCFTAGHHFDEYRKLNIKNPLFNANGGFFVLENFVREGQARSPTKSERDSADVKQAETDFRLVYMLSSA